MRRFIFGLIFLILFVIACSNQDREEYIRNLEGVQLYTAINPEATYTERVFKGEDAKLFAEVVKAECPQGISDEFVRTAFEAKTSTLIIYSDITGQNITCSVLKPKEQKQIAVKPAAEAPNNSTAVLVNSKPITISQIQQALALLPESTPKDANTINLVVNKLINEELLRQEAAKLQVSAEELATMRGQLLRQANITEQQLQQNLQSQGISQAEFDQSVKEQAQINKLLDQRLLLNKFQVTEEAARNFYLNNPGQFLEAEQAVMRQIFIASEGRTIDEGRARAQQIVDRLSTTDFCELVKTYTDDGQSKENCGLYVVPRGVIDPNLELAAFSTPTNQTSVVTTNSGIHLVQTLQVTPAQVVPYAQVAANVQQGLYNLEFQQRLNLYIAMLRGDADIVSYLG